MSESDEEAGERQAWLVAVASVVFDIDQGQTLEGLFPEGAISEAEGRDIAFNSESPAQVNCFVQRLGMRRTLAPPHRATCCRLPGLHVHGAACQVQHPGLHLLLPPAEAAGRRCERCGTQAQRGAGHLQGCSWEPLPEPPPGVPVWVSGTFSAGLNGLELSSTAHLDPGSVWAAGLCTVASGRMTA